MTSKKRLTHIEKHAPELPLMVFMQDLDNPDLWVSQGKVMTSAEVDAMSDTHRIIFLTWGHNGSATAADQVITLSWGDDTPTA